MAISYIPCSFPYFPIPYGCWCGITVPFPPNHDEPIDNFDEKCKVHDYCYEDAYPQVRNLTNKKVNLKIILKMSQVLNRVQVCELCWVI